MRNDAVIFVVIPALNEQASLPRVLQAMPAWVDAVYVGDNGSTDRTAEVAADAGAIVVPAPQRGYGSACLAALNAIEPIADTDATPSSHPIASTVPGCVSPDATKSRISPSQTERQPRRVAASGLTQSGSDKAGHSTPTPPSRTSPDIIVFLDADFSDHPEQMGRLVDPILAGEAELVIGSRVLGQRERGALTPQQRFGNALACTLMRWFWKVKHTDLGPFRAIRYDALQRLDMDDPNFGWTVQMQVRAAKRGIKAIDVPVDYRKRIGKSKISGTVRGVFAAGSKILGVIFVEALRRSPSSK